MKITVLLEGEKSTFAKGKILELIFSSEFFWERNECNNDQWKQVGSWLLYSFIFCLLM